MYPLMEAGIMQYLSFREYKEEILQNTKTQNNKNITDEQIIEQGMKIVQTYEKSKRGE